FGILLYFILSNDPMKVSWLSDKEKEYLLNALSDESKQKTQHYTIWQALKDKEVLKLALIYFLWITGFWGFNYWMPTVIKELSGWSNITIGSLFAIPMTVSLIVMVYIGYSSSKTGEKRLHGAIPLAIAALGLGAGVFIQDPVVNMLFVCIAAIGIFGPFGVWWSYPTTFLSGAAAAGAVGLINSSGNIGGYVGPYLIGIIKNLTNSFELSFLILAGMVLISSVMMLTLKKKA
ncbi:MAG TPA: MFS transporter, partial [Spirochaetota bacterium]|nr:MFS transporter [Spirochaetota bacterium]